MKKLLFITVLLFIALFTNAQLQDETNVSITMDLQPILQLNMETTDQVDFVFDDIYDYSSGITKYGATILKVSSTVNWDLYVVGYSNNGTYWDQQLQYGAVSVSNNTNNNIPLSALELYQYLPNTSSSGFSGAWGDYSSNFKPYQDIVPGQNSVYYSNSPYSIPGTAEKYVQGHGSTNSYVNGGSYFLQNGTQSAYYTVLDYRLVPGLPATFPAAGLNDGTSEEITASSYAQPGVYTMNVKYVLIENQ